MQESGRTEREVGIYTGVSVTFEKGCKVPHGDGSWLTQGVVCQTVQHPNIHSHATWGVCDSLARGWMPHDQGGCAADKTAGIPISLYSLQSYL